jgi:cell fate regulator YaaT (PSP1 superfamily)
VELRATRTVICPSTMDHAPSADDMVVIACDPDIDVGRVTRVAPGPRARQGSRAWVICRPATPEEMADFQGKAKKEDRARAIAQEEVRALNLPTTMTIRDAQFQIDGKRATFYYSISQKGSYADLHKLVPSLSTVFQTRICMVQD